MKRDITEDEILTESSENLESEINNDKVEVDETTEFQPPTIQNAFWAIISI